MYGLYLVYICLYKLYIYLDVHPRHWIRGCYCSKHRLDVLPICQEVLNNNLKTQLHIFILGHINIQNNVDNPWFP